MFLLFYFFFFFIVDDDDAAVSKEPIGLTHKMFSIIFRRKGGQNDRHKWKNVTQTHKLISFPRIVVIVVKDGNDI